MPLQVSQPAQHSKCLVTMPTWAADLMFPHKQLEAEESSLNEALLTLERPRKRKKMLGSSFLLWSAISLLMLSTTWLVYDKHQTSTKEMLWGTYERGFATEFGEHCQTEGFTVTLTTS